MFDFWSSTSASFGADLDPLVVVVDGDRQDLLGLVLTDHVLVEERVDLVRLRELVELELGGLGELLLDDLVAEVDALVADVHAGAGDELLDLLLALPAEGALQQVRVSELRHLPLSSSALGRPGSPREPGPSPAILTPRPALRAASSAVDPSGRDDLVDDAVLLGLVGGEDEVAVGVLRDLLDRLARVLARSAARAACA